MLTAIRPAEADEQRDEKRFRGNDQSDQLLLLKKPFDNIEVLQVASALTEKWRLAESAKRRVQDLETQLERRTRDLQRSNAQLAAANEQLALQTQRANERVAATEAGGRRK